MEVAAGDLVALVTAVDDSRLIKNLESRSGDGSRYDTRVRELTLSSPDALLVRLAVWGGGVELAVPAAGDVVLLRDVRPRGGRWGGGNVSAGPKARQARGGTPWMMVLLAADDATAGATPRVQACPEHARHAATTMMPWALCMRKLMRAAFESEEAAGGGGGDADAGGVLLGPLVNHHELSFVAHVVRVDVREGLQRGINTDAADAAATMWLSQSPEEKTHVPLFLDAAAVDKAGGPDALKGMTSLVVSVSRAKVERRRMRVEEPHARVTLDAAPGEPPQPADLTRDGAAAALSAAFLRQPARGEGVWLTLSQAAARQHPGMVQLKAKLDGPPAMVSSREALGACLFTGCRMCGEELQADADGVLCGRHRAAACPAGDGDADHHPSVLFREVGIGLRADGERDVRLEATLTRTALRDALGGITARAIQQALEQSDGRRDTLDAAGCVIDLLRCLGAAEGLCQLRGYLEVGSGSDDGCGVNQLRVERLLVGEHVGVEPAAKRRRCGSDA